MSRDDLRIILGVVIPNMEEGFEIKTRGGEIFRVDPNWDCCVEFRQRLQAEMVEQLKNKPPRVLGYS